MIRHIRTLTATATLAATCLLVITGTVSAQEARTMNLPASTPDNVRTVIEALPPLTHERGNRELVYQYSVGNLSELTDDEARTVVEALADRGIGVISNWQRGDAQDASIAEGIRIGRIQQSLGLTVAVDANSILHRFYDGTDATAHVDDNGEPFWDTSFAGSKMGCPFTLADRKPVILGRVAAFVEAYHMAGVKVGIATADWEIDGPHEWNEAWEHSKRCTRCRAHLANIEDFTSFQATMRQMRARLLRDCYTTPILSRFPDALVTNYAVYPNDGWRYWYDYFEKHQPDLPHRMDQENRYRPWYNDFDECGFTLAMPVVYTWHDIYPAYPEFSDPDYRWVYNMLLVGSNAGKSTPSGIPIATFVHWNTTAPPPDVTGIPQMTADAYRELLWHLLLRDHDILYSWTPMDILAEEIGLVQDVYNASLEYSDWLVNGRPVNFDVPTEQGAIVSGVRLGNKVLVRRSEFGGSENQRVTIVVDGAEIDIPSKPGEMQVIELR